MKIATYNVNSIRRRLPIVLDWISEHKPDVMCLQETIDRHNSVGDTSRTESFYWYLRYSLSYRDLEEITVERGLSSGTNL